MTEYTQSVNKIAGAITLAKEATEKIWGPIKRRPNNDPDEGREPWQDSENETPQIVIDTISWDTYQMVLNRLLEVGLSYNEEEKNE